MKVLERLELIRVILSAMDKELPFQAESFFHVSFLQRQPIFYMKSTRAHRYSKIFDWEGANLTIKNVSIE